MRSFDATAREFRRYHSNSFNVALHLMTTPTAMACALALVYDVSAEVMEGKASRIFDQAENRLHAQQALLAVLMGGL